MNRIRVFGIAAALTFALATTAQQTPSHAATNAQTPAHRHMPSVDEHLKLLSDKLDLTADQQAKIRPKIQELQDTMQKTMDDPTLSREEKQTRLRAIHEKADKDLRSMLTDEQKTKLDDLERQSHMQAH